MKTMVVFLLIFNVTSSLKAQKEGHFALEFGTGFTAPMLTNRIQLINDPNYNYIVSNTEFFIGSANSFKVLYGQKKWNVGIEGNANYIKYIAEKGSISEDKYNNANAPIEKYTGSSRMFRIGLCFDYTIWQKKKWSIATVISLGYYQQYFPNTHYFGRNFLPLYGSGGVQFSYDLKYQFSFVSNIGLFIDGEKFAKNSASFKQCYNMWIQPTLTVGIRKTFSLPEKHTRYRYAPPENTAK